MRRGPTALALSISLWQCAAEIALAKKPSAERPTYDAGMRWLRSILYLLVRSAPPTPFTAAWWLESYDQARACAVPLPGPLDRAAAPGRFVGEGVHGGRTARGGQVVGHVDQLGPVIRPGLERTPREETTSP